MPLATLLNPSDPIYGFEHMMRHRQYFAVMKPLDGFTAVPYLLDPLAEPDQPARNWNRNHQQAHNDYNTTLPGNQGTGFTLTGVTPTPAIAVGNANSSTSLTLSGVSGTIHVGDVVTDAIPNFPPVPPGTVIVAQVSGTPGGNGVYTTNQPTLLINASLFVTQPPYQQANVVGGAGQTFGINQPGVLLEGISGDDQNKAWWAHLNHMQHLVADNAILPLPTTAPTTAGTGPGQAPVSDPWWWVDIGDINFPFW